MFTFSTSNVVQNNGNDSEYSNITKSTKGIDGLANEKTGDEESDENNKEESRLGFDDDDMDDEKSLEMTEQELCQLTVVRDMFWTGNKEDMI